MPSNHLVLCSSLLLLSSIFPASGSSPMSWLFTSGSQSIGTSVQWIFKVVFLYDWLVWFPCSPRKSQESSPAPQFQSINSLAFSLLYGTTLTSLHDYWKNHRFDYTDLCQQSDISLFKMLSRLVIYFLPRSKHLLISWLQSPSTVILEPKEIKSVTTSTFFPLVHASNSVNKPYITIHKEFVQWYIYVSINMCLSLIFQISIKFSF